MSLKLSQKRTCNGCKALDAYCSGYCDLHYKVKKSFYDKIGMTLDKYTPLEPCFKPMTNEDRLAAYDRLRN